MGKIFLHGCEFSDSFIYLWVYCFASIAVHDQTAVVFCPGDGCTLVAGKVIPVGIQDLL